MIRPLLLALALPALIAAAPDQPKAEDRHGLAELTVHDFAAKYLMQQGDLADLKVYRDANAALIAANDPRPRIVLLGDSITFHWKPEDRPAPATLNVVDRGVVGQNSDQMLMRFEDDVVALKPAAVVLAGGSNDARVFVGAPADARAAILARIARNYAAMADIADARRIRVVIAAVTPCHDCASLNRDPVTMVAINDWLRRFAAERHYPFADYFAALADASGELPAALTTDGLHPTKQGYTMMWPKLSAALDALRLKSR
ncbi:MAG: lipase [Sphingomonas bacterium]|jgi:lysophospholipase L1-like esterase|nr:lipase [Sphingomonas bacterium]